MKYNIIFIVDFLYLYFAHFSTTICKNTTAILLPSVVNYVSELGCSRFDNQISFLVEWFDDWYFVNMK